MSSQTGTWNGISRLGYPASASKAAREWRIEAMCYSGAATGAPQEAGRFPVTAGKYSRRTAGNQLIQALFCSTIKLITGNCSKDCRFHGGGTVSP